MGGATNYLILKLKLLGIEITRLTGLSDKIYDEINELSKNISEYLSIISDENKLKGLITLELDEAIKRLNTERKTEILESHVDHDDEDLIQKEDMVVTVSHRGYIKGTYLHIKLKEELEKEEPE